MYEYKTNILGFCEVKLNALNIAHIHCVTIYKCNFFMGEIRGCCCVRFGHTLLLHSFWRRSTMVRSQVAYTVNFFI